MRIDVRPAVPPDVPGIRSVATAAWREAHAPVVGEETVEEFLAVYYDPESIRDRVEDEPAVLDVAVDPDGTILGYGFASRDADDEEIFHLAQIYVAPDRWGEGVGGRLLDRVEGRTRDRGGERVRLGVMADNDRAVGFDEAAGYERVDACYDERIETRSYTYENRPGSSR